MATATPFPLIEISGSARKRGEMHGEQARERVRLSAELYSGQLGRLGYDKAGAEALVAHLTRAELRSLTR